MLGNPTGAGGAVSQDQWLNEIAETGLGQQLLTQLRGAHARHITREVDPGRGDFGDQAPSFDRRMNFAHGQLGEMVEDGSGGGGGYGLDMGDEEEVGDDCFESGNVDLLNSNLMALLADEMVQAAKEQERQLISIMWAQQREMKEMDGFWAELDKAASESVFVNPASLNVIPGRGSRGRGGGRGRGTRRSRAT